MTAIPQVVTVVFGGSPAIYVSTQGFISTLSDDIGLQVFLPRIKGAITYERSVGCTVWGNSASKGAVGTIDLDNTDGALDSWLAETWRDRIVTIRRGLATHAYDLHDHVAFAVVDKVTTPDMYTIRVSLRDKSALLDIPLQDQFYGVIASVPTLEGTPKPIVIGEAEGVPLTLVHAGNLDYDVSDETPLAIDEVTDAGAILTVNLQWELSGAGVYGVRRLTSWFGKQVARVLGAPYIGGNLLDSLPDVLAYLLNRSGGRVYPDEQDPYSADALDTAAPYRLNYYGRDSTTIASVLTQVMDSFTGWWYFDRMGLLRVGRLIDPSESSESPVVELDDINLIGDITFRLDEAPGLSDSVGFARNWDPHGEGEIAGSVTTLEPGRAARIAGTQQVRKGVNTLHQTYAHAVGAAPIPTLLTDAADAQTEADRLTGLHEFECGFYDVTAALEGSLSYTLEPGDIVLLTSERFGLTAGKPLLVVAVRTNLMSSLVDLTLWGEGPQPGDF